MIEKILIILTVGLSCWASVTSRGCHSTQHCVLTHPRCTLVGMQDPKCLEPTLDQLRNSGKTIVNFQLLNISTGLPGGIFRDSEFETLIFNEFNMPLLNSSVESPFAGATKLRKLYFLHPVSELRMWQFEHLAALQLTELKFSHIGERFFTQNFELPEKFKYAGTNHIQKLEISTACIRALQSKSLSTFHNLEKLILTGNRIETISRDVFPPNPSKLRVIDLSINNIKTLAPQEFWNPNLPSLREVYLMSNFLSTFDKRFLTEDIEKFYINNNKVDCCPSMAWIADTNKAIWNGQYGPPATCKKPRNLVGIPLYNVTREQLIKARC